MLSFCRGSKLFLVYTCTIFNSVSLLSMEGTKSYDLENDSHDTDTLLQHASSGVNGALKRNPNPSYHTIHQLVLFAIGAVAVVSVFLYYYYSYVLDGKISLQHSCESPMLLLLKLIRMEELGRSPIIRREWRVLKSYERQNFIAAVQCLANSPSRLGLATTRYDDFVYVHFLLYSGGKMG